jgi:uncharacterized protein with FMN-binding domain
MKALRIVLIVVVLLIAAIVIGVSVTMNKVSKVTASYEEFDFSNLDLSTVEDGTYTGSEDGFMVKATVEVTVKDHAITNVKIISHQNGQGKPAEVIVNDIVAENSLTVDTISGATFSSNVIKKAVYNALTQE